MTTRALADPELLPILDFFPSVEFTPESLIKTRARLAGQLEAFEETGVKSVEATAKGRDGAPDVPLLVFNPPNSGSKRPAILHIHGGGMIIGSAAMSKTTFSNLSERLGVVVISVDYRLAPETPFPGPQEDCYAGLAWLFDNADALNIDTERVAVMGESAGGGLAAALALMVRDREEYALCAQILTYPMLDHRTGGPDCVWNNPTTGEFVWTRHANQFGWTALQGDSDLQDAYTGWFSPARAENLNGLAPAFIATGTLDLFFDEDMDYCRRLNAASVPCEFHAYPGAFHGFNQLPTARVSQQFQSDLLAALQRLLLIALS